MIFSQICEENLNVFFAHFLFYASNENGPSSRPEFLVEIAKFFLFSSYVFSTMFVEPREIFRGGTCFLVNFARDWDCCRFIFCWFPWCCVVCHACLIKWTEGCPRFLFYSGLLLCRMNKSRCLFDPAWPPLKYFVQRKSRG